MQNTNRTILNVSELNAEVSLLLKQGFPLLWVEGEISNFSRPASGHFYFSLKDSSAQIRCAMFKNRNMHIDVKPKNGLKVLVRGRIGLYESRGEFQLIAEHMEDAGAGLLQKQFEELKAKLAAKGWFDALFKKKLPTFPQQIGIISSPTGAALRDILNVLKRRSPQIPILIYPASVQGARAAIELESAVRQANLDKSCDVLIIARGGGSIEDLAAFNDENLASALYVTDIPIISGIGHEIDFTIADFIVDQRAPTPSAAAELVSPDSTQLRSNLHHLEQKMQRAMLLTLKQNSERFIWLSKRLQQKKPSYQLQQQSQRLDEFQIRLKQQMQLLLANKSNTVEALSKQLQTGSPNRLIATKQQKLLQLTTLLQHAIEAKLNHKKSTLALQLVKLDAMSPLKTLERGYAIVRDENKQRVISSISQVKAGEQINIRVKDGEIVSQVI
ncbi:MAG: exodeoxyribonuclease VII large subunit [Cocleimonas sp.]|nr:exodeoxyribonuclease VII large subunit [Cocleimonas sp.]